MYAICIHCQKALGRNASIEALPIGTRVAFDAEKGRLWLVCQHCMRWNLTPFEERWEALEQCERAFRATRVRQSTENIGLARLTDGTDLLRIGRPLRPEFAAWRYGDRFGHRRRTQVVRSVTAGTTIVAGVAASSLFHATLAAILPVIGVVSYGVLAFEMYRQHARIGARHIRLPDGREFMPGESIRLIDMPEARDGWGLDVISRYVDWRNENEWVRIPGEHAMPLLRYALPRINRFGAPAAAVAGGVALIERAGDPARFGQWALTQRQAWATRQVEGDSGDLNFIPVEARLAFEMATNEDDERRALDGELRQLEEAWREAEVVAGIADRLLVPPAVDATLDSMRKRQ